MKNATRVFTETSQDALPHSDTYNSRATFSGKLQNKPPVNPFESEGEWYKAGLHIHSTVSDGDADISARIHQYKALNYSILAITDHEVTTDVSCYSDNNVVVLNGTEVAARSNSENKRHLVCLNVPVGFKGTEEMSAQDVIDTVTKLGGIVIYGHPYYYSAT